MSEENVEIVRRGSEAMQRGDLDAAFENVDPEVEWEEMPSLGPDAAVYRGVDDIKEAVESWQSMWSDYESEIFGYRDAGDDVVVLSTERGRGRDSGVAVERQLGVVHTFRDGKVVRVRLFGRWKEALKAAGLSE